MGRNKLVVPVRAGADPHGFLGKYQGLTAKGMKIEDVAERITDILIRHEVSGQRMAEALVDRMVVSGSWDMAKRTMGLLERVTALTPSQIERLQRLPDENSEVRNAFGVPDRITALLRKVPS